MATLRDMRWENDVLAMESSIKKRNRSGRGGAPVPMLQRGHDRQHGKGQVRNELHLETLFSDAI